MNKWKSALRILFALFLLCAYLFLFTITRWL